MLVTACVSGPISNLDIMIWNTKPKDTLTCEIRFNVLDLFLLQLQIYNFILDIICTDLTNIKIFQGIFVESYHLFQPIHQKLEQLQSRLTKKCLKLTSRSCETYYAWV